MTDKKILRLLTETKPAPTVAFPETMSTLQRIVYPDLCCDDFKRWFDESFGEICEDGLAVPAGCPPEGGFRFCPFCGADVLHETVVIAKAEVTE